MGFLALDYYFKRSGLEWRKQPFMGAIRGEADGVIFIKPQNFYNETGEVVANYMRHFKISTSDVLAVCDNFDLDFGMIRYRASGSAGGNNGLKSIDAALGTSDYQRLRVGTGNDGLRQKLGDVEFVLSRFTPEERDVLPEILEKVRGEIGKFSQAS